MALNSGLTPDGIPLRVEGETFLMERDFCEAEINIPTLQQIKAKGKIFITTARMVFVNARHQVESFKAYDVPHACIINEKFTQPVFGSNYYTGEVRPLNGLLPGSSNFKLWFSKGNYNKFLKVLGSILEDVRKFGSPSPGFMASINDGSFFKFKVFFDQEDPSIVYALNPCSYNNYDPVSQFPSDNLKTCVILGLRLVER